MVRHPVSACVVFCCSPVGRQSIPFLSSPCSSPSDFSSSRGEQLQSSEKYLCVSLVAQLCPTLCNPMVCSPPASSVHGILQARIPKWVAMPFSRGSSQPRSPTLQADSLPSEPLGKPKNTGVGSLSLLEPGSPALQADSLPAELQGKPLEKYKLSYCVDIDV